MTDDYTKDGILYCGVCGEPKEHIVDVLGFKTTVAAKCACEYAEIEKETEEWKAKQQMMRISRLRTEGIKDRDRRKCRFENADMNDNVRKCMKYVENWEEVRKEQAGLLMWGPCGNGKSFCAACIANALVDKDIPVLMTSLPAILDNPNGANELVGEMRNYQLVILDDLGAERQSQYALEKVFYVIDTIYKAGIPLIVTTNQDYSVMKKLAYEKVDNADYKRIYDRVLAMCVSMPFTEGTRRSTERAGKVNLLKRVLA